MRTTLLAVAMALGLIAAAHAQTMVEYSNLATQATKSLAAPTMKSPSIPSKPSDTAAQKAAGDSGANNRVKIWEEKTAPGKQAPAKPIPPAVFVLSNGDRVESANYVVTTNSVKVTQDGRQRTIPMSSVNVDATLAANRQRGVDLKFPADKSQMMLSF